ncbi:hypothetical protein SAMN05216428_101111 [Nitrosospira sp. Nsp11]|uniref:hypothetical protein n=1 Tax=Nitrosospira sp. Nsp11 TaxID=1855338 RepID=UPI0009100BBC|nr:hypothetical protein [Nitrosospira sp. Nsp11]SHL11218.1 hypothetical protein SAMN05216428_101111 [Nitrosospira sp. Nsp11]
MKLAPNQRVVITRPAAIPAMQGRSGVVEAVLAPAALVDVSRGEAAIIRMDTPANLPGLHFHFLIFYAAECSPLDHASL